MKELPSHLDVLVTASLSKRNQTLSTSSGDTDDSALYDNVDNKMPDINDAL